VNKRGILKPEETIESAWINDECTVLLIRVQDFIWMWTRSKEQYVVAAEQ
jgi:hypothetical protein